MTDFQAVIIGGSAGGMEVMRGIFASIGENFPCPIIVIQHVERTAKFDYSSIFCKTSGLVVLEAEDKHPVEAGYIFFAPPGYHLYIEDDRTFGLSVDAPVNWSRPAIDPTFESAARVYGAHLIGVIITGANTDGADGLLKIKEAGGVTIVQDPANAVAEVMPRAAMAHADFVVSDRDIGPLLAVLVKAANKEGLS